MVAGIGAGDRRNGGARRLTAVAHYRAVGVEEKGLYEPWTNLELVKGSVKAQEVRRRRYAWRTRRPEAVKKRAATSISGVPVRFLQLVRCLRQGGDGGVLIWSREEAQRRNRGTLCCHVEDAMREQGAGVCDALF